MGRPKGSKNKPKEKKEKKEKKKVGRPRKITSVVPQEKKKVGRPRKITSVVPQEKKKVGRPKKSKFITIELEEDRIKLLHSMDRIPMLSDDGYRLKETISLLKLFGYSTIEIKKFLINGTIPLK